MSFTAAWLGADARRAIADRVRAVESKTSAELVVMVRARAAIYRHVDLAIGAAFGLVGLLVYVYAPVTFNDDLAPPAIAMCFLAGALLSSALGGLKRPFVGRRARREQVRLRARAAFVDQRIGATRSRRGVLVYISLFEREVEVLPDIGVDVGAMGVAWSKALAGLDEAVHAGSSVEVVAARLDAVGEALAAAMPITAGDENELPDEVAS